MRLFIAAYPPPAAITDLSAVVSDLALAQGRPDGASLRPVPPEQWHVTLAFLGEVADDLVPAAMRAMSGTALHRRRELLRLRLGGGGWFDNGRAAALWVGLTGDVEALQSLATDLRRELDLAGLAFDPRPYQPHLTLGRPGTRLSDDERKADLARLDAYAGPQWTVRELSLMRSEHPVSNAYTQIFTVPLNG